MIGYSDLFLSLSKESSKKINIVMEIDGAPQLISMGSIVKTPLYGDSGLVYGESGLLYGTFIAWDASTFRSFISVESSLTIGQTVEPEQGRSSLQQITIVAIDKDSYFTNLLSPGIVLDEPLGNKLVKIHLGFLDSSYPQDYVTVFVGYISSIKYSPGKYILQLSDAGSKIRAQLFYTGSTSLSVASITSGDMTIGVLATADLVKAILGPDGTYDSSITAYILIDSELIQYDYTTGLSPTSIAVTTRGVRKTVAASHTQDLSQPQITSTFQLQGNAIDLALKIMLSGWGGPYLTGITCLALKDIDAGLNPNGIVFINTVDVNEKYGLTSGDWVTVSGSSAGNNGSYQIGTIVSTGGGTNNLLLMTTNFVAEEDPATSVRLAFRSQYDTLPLNVGLKMSPLEVDVAQHQLLKNQFFSQSAYTMQFYITDRIDGKTFIESEIMLVIGAYRLTRFGRVSMSIAKPPIAGSNLTVIDSSNIINPQNMSLERSINNRLYYNEIQYRYDVQDDNSTFLAVNSIIDSNSLSLVAISTILPIPSKGLKTSLGALTMVNSRGLFLLNRYKTGAIKISLQVNWSVGATIETGDVVLLNDNGTLHLPNFNTGVRDLGAQLFEVVDRKFDIKSGQVTLGLLGNLGYALTDRFATIAPSSLIIAGSSTTIVLIKDSFGSLYPADEQKKWAQVIGTKITIHSTDYTTYNQTTTLIGFSPGDPYAMIVSPALSLAPSAGYIVEVGNYPSTSNPLDDSISKLLWAFIDPSVTVVAGVSNTAFTVGAGDVAKFLPGQPILVHNTSYSILSPEVIIDTVVGLQINLKTSLGFTPATGQIVEDIGFLDLGKPYKIL